MCSRICYAMNSASVKIRADFSRGSEPKAEMSRWGAELWSTATVYHLTSRNVPGNLAYADCIGHPHFVRISIRLY